MTAFHGAQQLRDPTTGMDRVIETRPLYYDFDIKRFFLGMLSRLSSPASANAAITVPRRVGDTTLLIFRAN